MILGVASPPLVYNHASIRQELNEFGNASHGFGKKMTEGYRIAQQPNTAPTLEANKANRGIEALRVALSSHLSSPFPPHQQSDGFSRGTTVEGSIQSDRDGGFENQFPISGLEGFSKEFMEDIER